MAEIAVEIVNDDDELYRRLAILHVNDDESINSAAYKVRGKPDNDISVDLARLTTPEDSANRAQKPGFGIGVLTADIPRALELKVTHTPVEDNPAHSSIKGKNNRAISRKLAEQTKLLKKPQSANG